MEDYGLNSEIIEGNNNRNNNRSCCCCCCENHIGRCIVTKSWREVWENDRRLLRMIFVLVIVLNIPYGNYVLYPFLLFSTWIHESCHGLAAWSVGGRVSWLNVYADGSGLANTLIPNTPICRAWVANAGYSGTAIVGGILLIFRRHTKGTRIGMSVMGVCVLLSCVMVVRNVFGLVTLLLIGIFLLLCGWKATDFWIREVYSAVASTTCLNAVTSIRALYSPGSATVGGVITQTTDASTMQSVTLIPYYIWATLWLLTGTICTIAGILIVLSEPLDISTSATTSTTTKSSFNHEQEEESPIIRTTELT